MRLEDLTPEDISSILRGEHPDFPTSNFLGKGADGAVYVNPNDSSKAVKFAIGKESAYKNEIDNLFEAQLREMDTPAIYESDFIRMKVAMAIAISIWTRWILILAIKIPA